MRTRNRTAVVVVPSKPFSDWLHSVDATSTNLTLADLNHEPTVYLLSEADSDSETENALAEICDRIFEEELDAWYHAPADWPEDRGIRNFARWFTYSFHSMLVDLCDDPPVAEDL